MNLSHNCDWKELFTDVMNKSQQSCQTLIIGVADNDRVMDSVIILFCIFLADESSETTFQSIKEKILALRHRIVRLREVVRKQYLGRQEMLDAIPLEMGIATARMETAWFTTNNCSPARKLQQLSGKHFKTSGQNSCSHLRNT